MEDEGVSDVGKNILSLFLSFKIHLAWTPPPPPPPQKESLFSGMRVWNSCEKKLIFFQNLK